MRSKTKQLLILAVITAVIAFVFAGFTQHVFEDYLITFKSSKNLAAGNGLVYHEGERVHTFTSPLGVLLPACFAWLTNNESDVLTLWLFRLVSIGALVSSVVVTRLIFERWSVGALCAVCGCLVLATDSKTVDFTINGMETGILVFFLSMTVYGLSRPATRADLAVLILGLAGLMWTRPDAFVYACSLTIAFFLFRCGAFQDLGAKAMLKTALVVVACSAAIYVPWLIFADLYYGTAVPNTVAAKGITVSHDIDDFVKNVILFPLAVLRWGWTVTDTFLPSYARVLGGWPWYVEELGHVVAMVAAFHWLFPIAPAVGRAVSLAACLSHLYLSVVVPFPYPWYLPVATYFSILSLMSLLSAVIQSGDTTRFSFRWPSLSRVAAVGAVVGSAVLLSASAYQLHYQQKIIESGNRKLIGQWLSANGRPSETVFMECLGYIGYYSGLKTLDFPGLSSKEMVSTRRELLESGEADNWVAIIERLEPDWLVLRPLEIANLNRQDPALLEAKYRKKITFDVSDRVSALDGIPGRGYLEFDQTFVIWQREDDLAASR